MVGDKVIGLPADSGKIVVYDVRTARLEFVEDPRLQGSCCWRTSAVVGDKVVGLPGDSGKIAVYHVSNGELPFLGRALILCIRRYLGSADRGAAVQKEVEYGKRVATALKSWKGEKHLWY